MVDPVEISSDDRSRWPSVEAFLRRAGYPGKYRDLVGPTMAPTPAVQHVAGLACTQKRVMVLCGAAGVGKTVAALSWMVDLIARFYLAPKDPGSMEWLAVRCVFAKAYELGRMNLRFNQEDRVRFARLKSVRFLILDDLGAEDASSVGLVEELVDHRLSLHGEMVITTNLGCHKPDAYSSPFGQRYGSRTVGRIVKAGEFARCGIEDLRRQGAQ